MRIPSMVAALLVVQAPAPAPGQVGRNETPPSEIVVRGHAQSEREIRNFVEALTDVPRGRQIGRFDWAAVCPAVVGLEQAQNEAVTVRIRNVAGAAGMRVARSGCHPNTLVIVTENKGRTIELMRRKNPTYFKDALERPIAIPKEAGPATAWHVTGCLTADGVPAERRIAGGRAHCDTSGTDTSRLRTGMRSHFWGAALVVEKRALAGLTLMQLADYAAMRTLASTDPSRLSGSGAPTILTILDAPMGAAVPKSLTRWDLGFLRGLASSSADQHRIQQRSEIRRQLQKELEGRTVREADE